MLLEDFFKSDGPLSACLGSYRPRAAQIDMAKAIERTLNEPSGRLLVEAGTGTGKSLAYLIAALQSDKKFLVSTATKTLQDQLVQKDLPLALKAAGLRKNVVLMKGRSNYLCLLKLEQSTLKFETETGDFAEIKDLPEDSPLRLELNASADTCLGQKCPLFQDCYLTRLRRKAQGADILVVNHALLCADQRNDSGFGQIIPPTEAWILDEAHALEDVATNCFGLEITARQVRYLARDLQAATPHIASSNINQYEQALSALLPAFLKIAECFQQHEARTIFDALKPELAFLEIALGAAKLSLLERRVRQFITDLHFLLSPEAAKSGYVLFVERDNRGMVLRAAPIEPAKILEKTLWSQEIPIVLTSATLAIQNNLSSFEQRIGLEDSEKLIFTSPFNTLKQSALYVSKRNQNPESEIKELVSLSQGGAFLLFTSHRAMNSCHENLKGHFESQGLKVFKQGEAPKLELVQNFVQANEDFGGVLFGTHSFWEGVDVQGRALRLVVIDKLPFKSPEDPIHQARSKRFEEAGLSSFYALSLPMAALALKQGVGRLLRTHEDRGVVAILDNRLLEKSYGRIFLETLSPMTPIHEIQKLDSFL